MKYLMLSISVALMLSGCMTTASMQGMSSGQIGCAPTDIKISDVDYSANVNTWTAECNHQQYYCAIVSISDNNDQVSCHAEQQ